MPPPIPTAALQPVPGTLRTSWIGNTLSGEGGSNGSGYWVQDSVSKMQVAPDGTLFAGTEWDEAGRCAGLYKDGKPGRVLLRAPDGPLAESAWGWGTANQAVAVDGGLLYVATIAKKLLRFEWTPGDVDSGHFRDAVDLPASPIGLSARGGRLAIIYSDAVEMRRTSDLAVIARYPVQDAQDGCLASDSSLWLLAGGALLHMPPDGMLPKETITGLQSPTAVSVDPAGRLWVCDNGTRQQVLCFDVAGVPKLTGTFGMQGGLSAGVPGEFTAQKLFALRGAGADAQGNLVVV